MGTDVVWEDMGPRLRGEYRWWCDTIALNRRMTAAQATASLAHELGHWRFGDRCSTAANERRAWEYGAALVITPDEYAAAERLVGAAEGALAAELGVTVRIIEAWRRWWVTRGQHLPPGRLTRDAIDDDVDDDLVDV